MTTRFAGGRLSRGDHREAVPPHEHAALTEAVLAHLDKDTWTRKKPPARPLAGRRRTESIWQQEVEDAVDAGEGAGVAPMAAAAAAAGAGVAGGAGGGVVGGGGAVWPRAVI